MSTSFVGKTFVWLPAKSVPHVLRNMNADPRAGGDERMSPPLVSVGFPGRDGAVGRARVSR